MNTAIAYNAVELKTLRKIDRVADVRMEYIPQGLKPWLLCRRLSTGWSPYPSTVAPSSTDLKNET